MVVLSGATVESATAIDVDDDVPTGANVGALAITPVETSGSWVASTAPVPTPTTTNAAPSPKEKRALATNVDDRRTGFSMNR